MMGAGHPRRLWQRYLVALGIVLALLIASHVASLASLTGGEEAAAVINVSGRQRMLSQRILYFAAEDMMDGAGFSPDPGGPLDSAIDLFEASHDALSSGGAMGLSTAGAAERAPSYFGATGGITLDALSRAFVADARQVAGGAPGMLAAWSRMQDIGPNGLLGRLNEAVSEFEAASRDRTRRVGRIAQASFAVAILVLIAEALLIFWPAQRTVTATLDRMEDANARLALSTSRAEALLRQANGAREEAETARRNLTQFVKHMSHELRTPLNGVIGMLTLMSDRTAGDDPDEMIAEARAASSHLLTIVNDTLDLSKLQAGKVVRAEGAFAPDPMARSALSIFRAQARLKGVELTCHCEADMPDRLIGDRVRISQVIANLVGNAVKFSDRGAVRLTLSHAHEGGLEVLRVEVRDDGPGIAPEDHGRLFDPFEQLAGSDHVPSGGTGLGLPICHQLVTLMGGTIGVDSEPGRGSRFRVSIPCPRDLPGDRVAAIPVANARRPDMRRDAGPLDVLIVDDNRTNCLVASRYLARLGHRTATAHDGREALEAVAAVADAATDAAYDVILMDIQMPVMDGIAAVQRLRAQEGPVAATPVIALTANAMAEDRVRFLDAGFDGYLAKPMTMEALSRALLDVLPPTLDEPVPAEFAQTARRA